MCSVSYKTCLKYCLKWQCLDRNNQSSSKQELHRCGEMEKPFLKHYLHPSKLPKKAFCINTLYFTMKQTKENRHPGSSQWKSIWKHVCFAVFKCFCSSKGKLELIRIFLAGKGLSCWMNKVWLCRVELKQSEPMSHYKIRILEREPLLQILM